MPVSITKEPLDALDHEFFLSHNWGKDRDNHERVSIINDALKKEFGDNVCWFDQDRMEGSTELSMTSGIDKSKKAIIFITKEYIRKVNGDGHKGMDDNCLMEFNYCAQQRGAKNMIPVVMDPECKDTKTWKGPVGFRLNNHLYIDFTNDDKLENVVKELSKKIQKKDRREHRVRISHIGVGKTSKKWKIPSGFEVKYIYHGRNTKCEGNASILHKEIIENKSFIAKLFSKDKTSDQSSLEIMCEGKRQESKVQGELIIIVERVERYNYFPQGSSVCSASTQEETVLVSPPPSPNNSVPPNVTVVDDANNEVPDVVPDDDSIPTMFDVPSDDPDVSSVISDLPINIEDDREQKPSRQWVMPLLACTCFAFGKWSTSRPSTIIAIIPEVKSNEPVCLVPLPPAVARINKKVRFCTLKGHECCFIPSFQHHIYTYHDPNECGPRIQDTSYLDLPLGLI